MKIVRVTPESNVDLDVRLRRADASVLDLATALHHGAPGATRPSSLVVDGIAAPGDLTLEEAGVRDGARVGEPGQSTAPPPAVSGGLLDLVVVAGLDAGPRFPLEPGSFLVGRSDDCDIVIPSATMSRRQCRIDVDPAGSLRLHNLSTSVGTFVDGRAVSDAVAVVPGALIEAGAVGFTIEWPHTDDAPAGFDRFRAAGSAIPLNRPPRFAPPPPPGPITIPTEPEKANKAPFGVATLLAPVVLGLVMYLALHSVIYLLFTAMSPVMMIGNWWETRHRSKVTFRKDTRTFHEDLERFASELDRVAVDAVSRLRTENPHPGEIVRRARLPSVRLWERRAEHPDFLRVDVGLGDVPWAPPLEPGPRQGTLPRQVTDGLARHNVLRQVPVVADLASGGVIGVVGPRLAALAVGRQLVCQVAVHHGPADLHLAVIAPSAGGEAWDWAKWLPHTVDIRPSATEQRLLAGDPLMAAALVEGLLADRAAEPTPGGLGNLAGFGDQTPAGPTTLYVIDGDELLIGRNSPTRQALRGAAGASAGIVLAATADRLPAVCTAILTVDEWGVASLTEPRRSGGEPLELVAAGMTEATARSVAISLARFEDPEVKVPGGTLTELVPLVDLLDGERIDAESLAARWKAHAGFHLRAPVGVSEHGEFLLDWDRHGPHGLVGGTTGSGKSELLKSLVASFAATYPPSELTFGLFDFKGGSTFTELADLPHTVGMASDLDVHLARRALRCLRAELLHREVVFDRAGVKDLGDYHARRVAGDRSVGALPDVPRLIVIIDEFAAMASELAEEIGALTDLTARGRSLGVHLLLATQKPSTAVNAEIRTNTRLRISLQVEDSQDSVDVIGLPDAAAIRQKGRGFFRVGQGEVLPIQSALSSTRTGADAGPPVDVAPFVFARSPRAEPPRTSSTSGPEGPSDLERLVAAIREAHHQSGADDPRRPWPDPLPASLTLDDLDRLGDGPGASPAKVLVALADDPEAQRRYPIGWPLRDGNLLLYGVVGSGTTTTLASLALAFARGRSVDDGHLYVLDFAAGALEPLSALPHCGAVVGPTDRERQIRLIRTIRDELDRRRALSPGERATEPQILVLIDNVDGFRATFDDPVGMQDLDRFVRIYADGPEVGIHIAASSARVGGVPHALANATPHKWLFRLADPDDFTGFGVHRKQIPTFVPGRFLVAGTAQEAQVALPGADLAAAVATVAASTPSSTRAPSQIRSLPTEVDPAEIIDATVLDAEKWHLALGRRDLDLGPAVLTLYEHEHGLIAGPARSGRSSALLTIAAGVRHADPTATVLGIATRRSLLRASPLLDDVAVDSGSIGALADRALASSGPTLVLVDDAETLDDASGTMAQLLSSGRTDLHVVVAGRADVLRSSFGHWTQAVRRSKAGVLIRPDSDFDGDLLGTTLPRRPHVAMTTGRGYLVSEAIVSLVQLADGSRRAVPGRG